MEFLMKLIKDPPVIIIVTTFWSGLGYMLKRYIAIAKDLKKVYSDLETFEKSNMSYRYEEFKQILMSNPCTARPFEQFKDALLFSDTIAFQDTEDSVEFENVSDRVSGIQSTVDIPYFFNEDSMITPHYNKNFLNSFPELLTGFGPFFTFLKIAEAFGKLDFSSPEALTKTVAHFVGDMQIAAICSVLAVGSCLTFTVINKLMTSLMLSTACEKVVEKLGSLFGITTTEAFLVDLLKTSKIQNHDNGTILKSIPKAFSTSIQKDLANVIMPYLDSLIFGVNNLNDTMSKKSDNGDELGGLF